MCELKAVPAFSRVKYQKWHCKSISAMNQVYDEDIDLQISPPPQKKKLWIGAWNNKQEYVSKTIWNTEILQDPNFELVTPWG